MLGQEVKTGQPPQEPQSQGAHHLQKHFFTSFPKGKTTGFSISSGTTISPLGKEDRNKKKKKKGKSEVQRTLTLKNYSDMCL